MINFGTKGVKIMKEDFSEIMTLEETAKFKTGRDIKWHKRVKNINRR